MPSLDITKLGGQFAALQFEIAAQSDIGRVRELNEDSVVAGSLDSGRTFEASELVSGHSGGGQRGPLAIVCDGMGGAQGGEVASELASGVIWREMVASPPTREAQVFARLLRRALRVASSEVYEAAKREGLHGMGTTAAVVATCGNRLVVANVGDSRVYIWRDRKLFQMTRDQSLASAMLAIGKTEEEAAVVGGAILQAIGVGPDVEPSLSICEICDGDWVMLCSDGVHSVLEEESLARAFSRAATVQQLVANLVNAANVAGGGDNISCVAVALRGELFAKPGGSEPRFLEFDPQKEGDPALTSTSYVARRLAARVGVATDPGPPPLPVTGQHRAVVDPTQPTMLVQPRTDVEGGSHRYLNVGRISWHWWLLAAIAVALVTWTLAR